MRISVVIPSYNRAAWIPATVASVLAQRHAPHEVIVVDDGSTDETPDVCRRLPTGVRYVRQQNGGVSAARNYGVQLATGDLVAFVDSDDLWHPDKLAVQAAAFAAYPACGWSATGCDMIGLDGAVIGGRRGFEAVFPVFAEQGRTAERLLAEALTPAEVCVDGGRHRVFHGDAYGALFWGNFILPSSAVVRRSLFLESGGFDAAFRVAEETEFFHRLSARSPVVIVETSLVGYRIGAGGSLISPANVPRLIENALRSLDNALALRPATPTIIARHRAARVALLRRLAYFHLSMTDGAPARAALAAARASGGGRDPVSLAILAASYLPSAMLRRVHAIKRSVRA